MIAPNPHLYVLIEFFERDGIRHHSTSWALLIDKVREYRERLGLPVGDLQKEIFTQVCTRNPAGCREQGRKDGVLPTDDLHKSILGWLGKIAENRKKIKFVSEAQARQQAAICAACSRLRPWRNACGACTGSADKIVAGLLAGKAQFDNSRGCASLREDPRASVWIEQPPVEGPLPDNCWRKA